MVEVGEGVEEEKKEEAGLLAPLLPPPLLTRRSRAKCIDRRRGGTERWLLFARPALSAVEPLHACPLCMVSVVLALGEEEEARGDGDRVCVCVEWWVGEADGPRFDRSSESTFFLGLLPRPCSLLLSSGQKAF